MEARSCLAEWQERDEQLVLHISTQVPHQVRSGVAQALGLHDRQVRVIAPDVGGGFGLKCVVGREEVVAAAIAPMSTDHGVVTDTTDGSIATMPATSPRLSPRPTEESSPRMRSVTTQPRAPAIGASTAASAIRPV